jgi:hypothetical protein
VPTPFAVVPDHATPPPVGVVHEAVPSAADVRTHPDAAPVVILMTAVVAEVLAQMIGEQTHVVPQTRLAFTEDRKFKSMFIAFHINTKKRSNFP